MGSLPAVLWIVESDHAPVLQRAKDSHLFHSDITV